MGQVDFDPKKIKKVDINLVVPNTWNPKDKKTKEYDKVKESIFQKGLRGFIAVRNHPTEEGKYEILDGEQRWTAASELGYEEIHVYNEGVVTDKEAKELTIWWQQQVPFERIAEAHLVSDLVKEFGIDVVELPYTVKEIDEFKTLAEFDFGQYVDSSPTDDLEGDVKTFKVVMGKEAYEIVMKAINRIKAENDCGDARALELMSADYLSSVTGELDEE